MPYEVTCPELSVLKAVGEFRDPVTGEVFSYDHKARTYYEGEVVPDDNVSPVIRMALDEANEGNPTYVHLSGKLKKLGDTEEARLDIARRLGLPYESYEDLSEDEVLDSFKLLSSPLISAVKEYEARNEGRARILEYDAGRREGVDERVSGKANAEPTEADTTKSVGEIQTRSVGIHGDNTVTPGEGYTGSDPKRTPKAAKKK